MDIDRELYITLLSDEKRLYATRDRGSCITLKDDGTLFWPKDGAPVMTEINEMLDDDLLMLTDRQREVCGFIFVRVIPVTAHLRRQRALESK